MKVAGDRQGEVGSEEAVLRSVHIFNLIMLGLLVAVSWYAFSWDLARSVLIGGFLATTSFLLLGRDIRKMIDSYARAGENRKTIKKVGKVRLLMNFYLRLGVVGLILFQLQSVMSLHMIGLAMGLSTIMLSVVIVVLSKKNMLYSAQRLKEA